MDWLLNLIQLADEIKKYAQLNNPDSVELIAYQHEASLKEQSKPSYATVKVLSDELNDYATPNEMPSGTIRIILVDPYGAMRALTGLSDRGGRDDGYYISEANSALDKLLPPMYFGGVAER